MADKILVLYIDMDKVDLEEVYEVFGNLKKLFPNRECICLPDNYSLIEMDRTDVIENLQKIIETLSQE